MSKVTVIAEVGVNHNGDLDLAKSLVDVAYKAGANYVKFQSFKADRLVRKDTDKAKYQSDNTGSNETQYEMLKKLELTNDMYKEIFKFGREKGIPVISTAFDEESADMLNRMGQEVFKIPSGEITNLPLLRTIGRFRKDVFLSTGMANIKEIESAIQVLEQEGVNRTRVTVLHCTSSYPAPIRDVNLLAMREMSKILKTPVGYSDHTLGISVAIGAAALGASVIEKHFTLNKDLPGPDHKASLDPNELREMVTSVRLIEDALGSTEKRITESEKCNMELVRKSIVARTKIKKGETFTTENLTTKRPAIGISPMKWDSLMGKVSSRDYEVDDFIEL